MRFLKNGWFLYVIIIHGLRKGRQARPNDTAASSDPSAPPSLKLSGVTLRIAISCGGPPRGQRNDAPGPLTVRAGPSVRGQALRRQRGHSRRAA